MGSGGQIVCIHSPELSTIIVRAEGADRKPDVTSFFDGFISSLPVAGAALSSVKRQDLKSGNARDAKAVDSKAVGASRGMMHAAGTAAQYGSQSTAHDTDIKQLKQVLDTINTTKTIAKFTLTQQARCCSAQCIDLTTATHYFRSSRRNDCGAEHLISSMKTG